MSEKFSGRSFEIYVGAVMVRVQEATLEVNQNTTVADTGGDPDGWLDGVHTASGKLMLVKSEHDKIMNMAAQAGSWMALDPVTISFEGSAGGKTERIVAYGCKLKKAGINVNTTSGDQVVFEVAFDVTSPQFVTHNGVPFN